MTCSRLVRVCYAKHSDSEWRSLFRFTPGLSTRVSAEDFILYDQYVGPGYAKSYPAVKDAIRLAAQEEGILLDPVYTGKCMHGLLDQISGGTIVKDHTVVFLHSGGAPNLFVQ